MKAFGSDLPSIKVGILGDKNARRDQNSNATIGAKHEFGLDGMPIRSFLRIPIADNLQVYLEKAGAFNKAVIAKIFAEKNLLGWMKAIAVVAENIVQDAFKTGGFGKWTPSNMKYKKTHQTLVETQQLQRSITSEVK